MYSVWGLAADVAYTQQEKQHTCSEDKTCFFIATRLLKEADMATFPSIGHDAILCAIHIIEGRVRGPLFNLIIADGLVFGRAAYLKTPESQRFHSIREPWGWS